LRFGIIKTGGDNLADALNFHVFAEPVAFAAAGKTKLNEVS
jgi:hypothetical protein